MPTVRQMKAKMALVGEGGVGKTSLVRRFVLNEYTDTYLHTVGTRVSKVALTIPQEADNEIQMDLSVFDIIGQREFRDLVRETYFHGVQGLMAVCDITRLDSLTALDDWIPSSLEIAGDVPVFIVVNKKDLADRRAFADDEVRKVAEPHSSPFVFTSAKTGEFVDDAFNALALAIADRAVREDRARNAGAGLHDRVLTLLSKRGPLGLKRNQFFEILRGVKLDELQAALVGLEREGLVVMLWNGPADFTATITKKGLDQARRPSSFLEE